MGVLSSFYVAAQRAGRLAGFLICCSLGATVVGEVWFQASCFARVERAL
jgi:hypothetical protein